MSTFDLIVAIVAITSNAAGIFFGWQQNQIFREQNRIFAAQAGIKMPETTRRNKIGLYWPAIAALLLAVGVGVVLAENGTVSIAIPWAFVVLCTFGTTISVMRLKGSMESQQAAIVERDALLKKLSRTDSSASQLNIIKAEFRAFAEGGDKPDVTEVLKHKIVGDSLVFKVDRGDFKAPGLDPVSRDPFEGQIKRVEVTYSYQNDPPVTTESMEDDLLVLPEDIVLEPLQRHALRLSVKLLQFLNELGPRPTPKYTEEEVRTMPDAKMRSLIDANDVDYTDACEFHYPQGHEFTGPLKTWCDRVEAGYALQRFSMRVQLLSNLFALRGLKAAALSLPISGRDAEVNVRKIARSLWDLAYKVGKGS